MISPPPTPSAPSLLILIQILILILVLILLLILILLSILIPASPSLRFQEAVRIMKENPTPAQLRNPHVQ